MGLLTKTIRQIVASGLPKEQMFNELKGIPEHKELVEETFKRIVQHVKDNSHGDWHEIISDEVISYPIKKHLYVSSPDKLVGMSLFGKGEVPFADRGRGSYYDTLKQKTYFDPKDLFGKPEVIAHEPHHEMVNLGNRPISVDYTSSSIASPAQISKYDRQGFAQSLSDEPLEAGNYGSWSNIYGGFGNREKLFKAATETDAMLAETASAKATGLTQLDRPNRILAYLERTAGPDKTKEILDYYRDIILGASPIAAGVGMARTGEENAQ